MLHRKHQRELQEKEEKKKERPSLTPRRQASQSIFNLAAVTEAVTATDQDTRDVTKRVGTLVKRSSLAQLPVTEETEAVHAGKDQQVPNIPPRSIGGKSLLTIAGRDHSSLSFQRLFSQTLHLAVPFRKSAGGGGGGGGGDIRK